MKYILLIVLLCLVLLLSTIYSEAFDTYVMKNALINNTDGSGRLYTMDTDGNFNASMDKVTISNIGYGVANTPAAAIVMATAGTPPPIFQNSVFEDTNSNWN